MAKSKKKAAPAEVTTQADGTKVTTTRTKGARSQAVTTVVERPKDAGDTGANGAEPAATGGKAAKARTRAATSRQGAKDAPDLEVLRRSAENALSLVDGAEKEGTRVLACDGTDASGRRLAAGVPRDDVCTSLKRAHPEPGNSPEDTRPPVARRRTWNPTPARWLRSADFRHNTRGTSSPHEIRRLKLRVERRNSQGRLQKALRPLGRRAAFQVWRGRRDSNSRPPA